MAKDKTDDQEEVQEEEQKEQSEAQPQEQEQSKSSEPEEVNQEEQVEETPSEPRRNLKLERLISRMDTPGYQPSRQDQLDYRQALDADDEVFKQLETDRQVYGQSQYQEGLKQAEALQFRTFLEIDSPKVENLYKEHNIDSNTAGVIDEWYLRQVGFDSNTGRANNPKLRYNDFVEGILELANNIAGEKNSESARNIARQAGSTGLRPDGSQAKRLDLEKAPKDMTDEELKAVIAQSI